LEKSSDVVIYGEGLSCSIKRAHTLQMGNKVSTAVEKLVHSSIYQPPYVNYTRRVCRFVRTRDGDSIAMRLYSPDADVVNRFVGGEIAASEYDLFIFSHGNGSDIGATHRFCEHLSSALLVDVLVYDYPQYGHSSSTSASESNLLASMEAVFETCQEQGWTQTRTFLLGHSLGSVPTLHIAAQPNCRVSGVVLLAPLASGSRVVLQNSSYVPEWLIRRLDCVLFDNMSRIAKVCCPIAIVHGTDDTTVPVVHTELLKQKIHDSSQFPCLFLATGHNELVDVCSRDLMKITEYIRKFREKCLLVTSHYV
jgi:pimeloyl-ACP methyl ester carboxylesterase